MKFENEEKNRRKCNEKGITLIALAITIVVLIILAGVSINAVVGDDGIIKKAQESANLAKNNEAKEIINRTVLEFGLTGGYDTLEDFLKTKVPNKIDSVTNNGDGTLNVSKNGYTVTVENKKKSSNGTSSGDNTGGNTGGNTGNDSNGTGEDKNNKLPVVEPTADTAPYFPDDTFTKADETTTDTGLVIQDAVGNQYVWVVVPKSLYNDASYNSNGDKKPASSTDYANIEYCLQQYVSTFRSGISCSDTWKDDTDNVGWLTEDEYETLKNSMLKSVYENGGFYAGRYEAGIETTETSRTSNTDTNSDGKYTKPELAPVTKADAYPYTYVTRTQAQNLSKSLSDGKSYTSSLMFGLQWDLVLAFMSKDTTKINQETLAELKTYSETIGNYSTSKFQLRSTGKYAVYGKRKLNTWSSVTTANGRAVDSDGNKLGNDMYPMLITTGTSEQNKVMNIYDIAGNVWEWTLEKRDDSSCIYRGGWFGTMSSAWPAYSRGLSGTTSTSEMSTGFRVSIWQN